MILKKELALMLTSELKSLTEAKAAQEYFETVFQKKSLETNITEKEVDNEQYIITDLIVKLDLAPSKSQARRLIEQGAVKMDDSKISDWQVIISFKQPHILKVGKKLLRVTYQPTP